MSKKKHQKTVSYKGETYIGSKKNGVLAVKVKRTANGQLLTAGSMNIETREWQDGNKKCALPDFVKREFERAFA